jgi:hypothetical protein
VKVIRSKKTRVFLFGNSRTTPATSARILTNQKTRLAAAETRAATIKKHSSGKTKSWTTASKTLKRQQQTARRTGGETLRKPNLGPRARAGVKSAMWRPSYKRRRWENGSLRVDQRDRKRDRATTPCDGRLEQKIC